MKATEKQAVDWLERSLAKSPADFLGRNGATCSRCGRDIAAAETRTQCAECGGVFCADGPACEHEKQSLYKGFPLIEDLAELIPLARKHLAEACYGRFHVDDSIWFSGFTVFIDYLENRITPSAEFATDLDGRSPDLLAWLDGHAFDVVSQWVSLKQMGRFVEYAHRRAIAGNLPDFFTSITAQGMNGPVVWAGRPTMRSVWDFALAPLMVDEIRPRTIIELGTASGGGTTFWADLQKLNGLKPNVVSMDIDPPDFVHEGVTLLRGDSNRIGDGLPDDLLASLPHPWLIIEDAHVNIAGVLEHIDRFTRASDYLIVEDVEAESTLGPFLAARPGRYQVDTFFTDYFGHNATCAPDQIFRRAI
ncbi:CmcI family methyltransferase [Rhodococcoides fascians]|uniref:CmcI family methyltransferase n=1 Tax=Rhodococcoides fascians TaxID=1828 RepID=UPI00366D1FF0